MQAKDEPKQKEFKLYDDCDILNADFLDLMNLENKITHKQETDDDVQTDQDILENSKKECMLDLKKAIKEYESTNPKTIIRNLCLE